MSQKPLPVIGSVFATPAPTGVFPANTQALFKRTALVVSSALAVGLVILLLSAFVAPALVQAQTLRAPDFAAEDLPDLADAHPACGGQVFSGQDRLIFASGGSFDLATIEALSDLKIMNGLGALIIALFWAALYLQQGERLSRARNRLDLA